MQRSRSAQTSNIFELSASPKTRLLSYENVGSLLSKPDRLPVESLLLDVADVLATSLDLDTTLRRVAEVVRKVIDYEIFAILLLIVLYYVVNLLSPHLSHLLEKFH